MAKRKKRRKHTPSYRRWLLIGVAVVCFGVALSYPIRYFLNLGSNNAAISELSAMRQRVIESQDLPTAAPLAILPDDDYTVTPTPAGDGTIEPTITPAPTATPVPTDVPGVAADSATSEDEILKYILNYGIITPTPRVTSTPAPVIAPTPTPDRSIRVGVLPYPMKEKAALDERRILPELREIYAMNHDMVGWLSIPDSNVDYPVLQNEDDDYYLTRDFYRVENNNGQLILLNQCDPYTPSYNLVISGHNMLNGTMFARILYYSSSYYWRYHKIVEFDTLMERKRYVVFAAFYSADYDEDEEGFRYNADIQYRQDAEQWLKDIDANKLYDTGITAQFGDEFITLTTCTTQNQKNGRFVVVCRRIREGETFS